MQWQTSAIARHGIDASKKTQIFSGRRNGRRVREIGRGTKEKACAARRTTAIVAGGRSGSGKAPAQVRTMPFALAANSDTNLTT